MSKHVVRYTDDGHGRAIGTCPACTWQACFEQAGLQTLQVLFPGEPCEHAGIFGPLEIHA